MVHTYHTVRVAVYAFFVKDHKILLLFRKNTGWMDGRYGLPSGHMEKGETIKDALRREIKKEVGIEVDETDLTFYHAMHRHEKSAGNFEYVDFFFKVEYWVGEPTNTEPEKAAHIKWFDMDKLPTNMVPNVKMAIEYFRNKLIFSEFG